MVSWRLARARSADAYARLSHRTRKLSPVPSIFSGLAGAGASTSLFMQCAEELLSRHRLAGAYGELLGENIRGCDPAAAARREAVSIGVRGRREARRCALICIYECCERPCGGSERTVTSPLACEVVVVAKNNARPRGYYRSRSIASCPARAEGTGV